MKTRSSSKERKLAEISSKPRRSNRLASYSAASLAPVANKAFADKKKKDTQNPVDPYPPFTRNYPNMRQRNYVVNRCHFNTPKPKPSSVVKPQLGTDVFHVPEEEFNSRVAFPKKLRKNPKSRVVGESCFFGRHSHHERLLQLQCEANGAMWYVKESQVQIPHFLHI